MDRSEIMRAVRRKNTQPEMVVRRLLHALGFRYRLHRKDLPGTPDIVLPKHRAIIFVNGCFWHHHQGCTRASTPKTNPDYWLRKFERNKARDARNHADLKAMGWRVLVIWGCEIGKPKVLARRMKRALASSSD